jgi:hypothetical protein
MAIMKNVILMEYIINKQWYMLSSLCQNSTKKMPTVETRTKHAADVKLEMWVNQKHLW